MKYTKLIFNWISYLLLIPIIYIIISIILMSITVNNKNEKDLLNHVIYIKTNGVHLDLIIPKKDIIPELLFGVQHSNHEDFLAFGWGDEQFYLNTPTWNDLTFSNAFQAIFLDSSTLIHLTRYQSVQEDWIKILISDTQLNNINLYILKSFKKDQNRNKFLLKNKGYSSIDNFYKANGSYSLITTCNTWVNCGLKQSGIKACYWTPFDFGLTNIYEE